MDEFYGEDVGKAAASRRFEEKMRPVLELMRRTTGAEEVFVDGDELWLAVGERDVPVPWEEVKPVTPAVVRGAMRNAAVFGAREFGPRPPAEPLLTVKVPPRWRVSVAMPPAAPKWHVAIRHLMTRALTLPEYEEAGIMTRDQRLEIEVMLDEGLRMIVSGGTRAGKTVLLGAMLRRAAREDRTLVLEDTPELVVQGRNVVQMQTCPGVDLGALLRHALRMNPRRIVVGEVRGPEALELVTASNTGHDGTLCTLHSNGREHALSRLHTQVRKVQPTFPFEEVREAVDAVVQIEGQGKNRRLTDIWRLADRPEGRRVMTRPGVALAAFLALAACVAAPPGEPADTRREPPPDLARSGGVNRAAGTAVPMAIGCRALSVARALTRSAGIGQLSSACSAASRL